MSKPLFSIIVPHYNQPQQLTLCLEALCHLKLSDGISAEIIVVDNGSTMSLEEMKLRYPNCVWATERKVGSYSARNLGSSIAKGSWLIFIDSDCIADSRLLEQYLAHINSTKAEAIGGAVLSYDLRIKNQKTCWTWYDEMFSIQQQYYVSKKYYAATANFCVKKEWVSKLNGFKSHLKSAGDIEFGNRLTENGCVIHFCSDAIVYHCSRTSLKEFTKKRIREAGGAWDRLYSQNFLSGAVGILRELWAFLKAPFIMVNRLLVHHVPFKYWGPCFLIHQYLLFRRIVEIVRLAFGGESIRA